MKLFKAKDIRMIDDYCIKKLEIPLMLLIENTALAVLKHLELEKNNSFIVVCGIGNNGADGLAIARHLIVRNKDVDIFIVGDTCKASEGFKSNRLILENMNIELNYIKKEKDLDKLTKSSKVSDLVVDCIFGTGVDRKINGLFMRIIEVLNKNSKCIHSVDLPSGINSDTGEIMGISVFCNKTVTIACYKEGMINDKVRPYFGDIYLENIGIPEFVLDKFHNGMFLTDSKYIKELIPTRPVDGHKGKFGKVVVIAGSKGFTGAAYISTKSAIKTGSGLVTLCTDSYTEDSLSSSLVEAMSCNYQNNKEKFLELLKSWDCVAIGPGLGDNKNTLNLLKTVIKNHSKNILIDADGLNVLKENLDILKQSTAKIIITPHPGEMARLIGKDIPYVNSNRVEVAKTFASKLGIVVLLKGSKTVITDGEKVFINPTGCSAMSSGGMGDSLTGIIISLVGQGIPQMEACILGAYLHGYIAQELAKDLYTVQASDIIANISRIMKKLEYEK
ncbi:NAD(P)H-hydrate dehydratase [uncultured Clostridium sp.]|uniref:NAD(P)H-hydrate dehydratase n=1 Tax=uncultured Clostridium sp. TaxID=59620 RepID=UPI00262135AC|nr:NAD(P)H-hydrate dehydratase [uncultured Clostridium sp.]